jgi:hypothetical protein
MERRQEILDARYRTLLRDALPAVVAKWEADHGSAGESIFHPADEETTSLSKSLCWSGSIWARSP